jgi:hypothetical protein
MSLQQVIAMSLQIQKLQERTGNVYENKGSVRKEWERSGNVIENKSTYTFLEGMLLKIQKL